MSPASNAIPGLPALTPRRSLILTLIGVAIRAGVWALLIFGLAAIVPRVLPAIQLLQPKQPLPQGPVMDLVRFLSHPQKSIPFAVMFLAVIDLPVSYLCSNRITARRGCSRLMMLVPLGLGLIAGLGFAFLYVQTLSSMIQDVSGR